MSWLDALARGLERLGNILLGERTEEKPKPKPPLTSIDLGWDEEPTSKGDKPS